MSFDQTRINNIENNLKNNPKTLSNNDLIYYLKYNSNNEHLDDVNLKKSEEYFKKINNSFIFENIFVNNSNYASILPSIIGLLLPFYYFYPRFYKIGFIGCFIGFVCLLGIYTKLVNLYSNFFKNIGISFLGLSLIIYIVFFIALNKLNHISLFFISAVISYLIINYISRVSLTLPIKSNVYNQYRATMNGKKKSKHTEYNILLEKACYLVMERYKLKLPSGKMLYSYLSEFQIGDNTTLYTDFFSNLFGPFISLSVLWLLGNLLSLFKNDSLGELIEIFPIIGINDNSQKYFTCQANYILPRELNMGLLIHDCIDKYNFDEKIYKKVEKALSRISKELLTKYNPKFIKIENENNKIVFDNLKNNKIYIEIIKLLKKNNFEFNIDYIDEMKNIIRKQEIPFKNKRDMFELLEHINNILIIKKEINETYENDTLLARNELLYDKDIYKPDDNEATKNKFKNELKNILNDYINNFRKNLGLKEISNIENNYIENNNIKNNITDSEDVKLFGYHYNIITYSLFSDDTRMKSNKLFKSLLRMLSTWLLLAKPIGSSWLIVKYMLLSYTGFKKLLNKLSSRSIIWKYFTMGLDTSYLEDSYRNLKNNNENSILKKGLNLLYTSLIFIFVLPILTFYNSITYGFILSPAWYNILYQIAFIINIVGNISCYYTKQSHFMFNIIFIIVFIVIMIIISTISYFMQKK